MIRVDADPWKILGVQGKRENLLFGEPREADPELATFTVFAVKLKTLTLPVPKAEYRERVSTSKPGPTVTWPRPDELATVFSCFAGRNTCSPQILSTLRQMFCKYWWI